MIQCTGRYREAGQTSCLNRCTVWLNLRVEATSIANTLGRRMDITW